MKNATRVILALALTLVCAAGATAAAKAAEATAAKIRDPVCAGGFYPDGQAKLAAAVESLLAGARPAAASAPVAIVSPHAGYAYSGQIAADAWNQAAGADIDLVVILGVNHRGDRFRGVSVYDGDGYRTPLGTAPIDRAVVTALLGCGAADFVPAAHRREPSVEVQVPFAQTLFPDVPIVAAIVGSAQADERAAFATALKEAAAGRRILIVASSDLSHYPAYDRAAGIDHATLRAMAACDPTTFAASLRESRRDGPPGLATCACGEAPIMLAMAAARALGAAGGRVVSYANSGDTAIGDIDRVVGYGAVAFVRDAPGPDSSVIDRMEKAELDAASDIRPDAEALDPAARKALLRLARTTLEQFFATGATPLVRDLPPCALRRRGAFVTLQQDGRLRGCIGHMSGDAPLGRTVSAMAYSAAFADRRFPPLAAADMAGLHIEISVLTPMARVPGPDAVRVGTDGVLIRKSGRSAVFLPQVAVEQGWDRETLLSRLCRKAGLPADAWREGADISTFQAVVFGE